MGGGTFPDQGSAAASGATGASLAGVGPDLRIGRDGTWYYRGSPIRRPALVKLFASALRRDDAGDHWLVTPVERGRVDVDDAPFVAVELRAEDAGAGRRIDLRTNLDVWWRPAPTGRWFCAATVAPRRGRATPAPYVVLDGGLEARLERPVYDELVEPGESGRGAEGGRFGVWSRGRFLPLGDVES